MRRVTSMLMGASMVLFAACGGGGGGDDDSDDGGNMPAALKGRFVDSPVAGVAYSCGAFSGTTDSTGGFDYEANSVCTFRIGGITLGSANAAVLITPVQLVNGAVDESNAVVANIARLLISLDSDNDPANGITIESNVSATLAAASLDISDTTGFDSLASALVASAIAGRPLASATYARSHLNTTLLSLLNGRYACPFTGGDTGNSNVTVSNGLVTGSGTARDAGPFALSGQVRSSGSATLTTGATTTGATFSGAFRIDGTGSGTWRGAFASGTWSCTKV